ncbi:MAG: glycosyltransferase family 2 protein, partial [Mesorhizobium sp.]
MPEMDPAPLITVITLTHNRRSTVLRAVESVLA